MSQTLRPIRRGMLILLCLLSSYFSFAQNGSDCYKPITGIGTEVNPVQGGLICLGCSRTGINNVTDADKNNYADLSQLVTIASGNGISVKQSTSDYPSGYYAGFVISLGNEQYWVEAAVVHMSIFKQLHPSMKFVSRLQIY